MSAEFYTILPPPQTLETLDNWGSLDDLPLSLDSPAWETAGIYGLTIADGAKASGSLEGSRQTAIPLSPAQAQSGAALAGALRIRTDSLAGSAKAGGSVSFQRIRSGSLVLGAVVSEDCFPLRIRQASMVGEVAATASALWIRVRLGAGAAHASGFARVAEWLRTRTDSVAAEGVTGGAATGYLIRSLQATGTAHTAQASAFERLRLDVLTARATLSGRLKATLLGNDRMYGYAYSGEAFEGQRTRTALVSGTAAMSGTASGVAIRGLVLRATATASGQLSVESGIQLKATATTRGSLLGEVLGFGWQGKTRAPGGEWGEKIVHPEPWQGKRENAAEWAQEGENKQGWNAEKAESGEWVKHGDEQGSLGIWSMGAGCGPVEWSASAGGEELRPGKAWVQAHERHSSDGVPASDWQGAGCFQPQSWGKPADVGGHGWRNLRA